jgi:hypothetical protein
MLVGEGKQGRVRLYDHALVGAESLPVYAYTGHGGLVAASLEKEKPAQFRCAWSHPRDTNGAAPSGRVRPFYAIAPASLGRLTRFESTARALARWEYLPFRDEQQNG